MTKDCDSRIQFPALPWNSSMSWLCDPCSILVSHDFMWTKQSFGGKGCSSLHDYLLPNEIASDMI